MHYLHVRFQLNRLRRFVEINFTIVIFAEIYFYLKIALSSGAHRGYTYNISTCEISVKSVRRTSQNH